MSKLSTPATQRPSVPAKRQSGTRSRLARWRVATKRALHRAGRWVRIHLCPVDCVLVVPSRLSRPALRGLLRRIARLIHLGYLPQLITVPSSAPTWQQAQTACLPVAQSSKKKGRRPTAPANAAKRSGRRYAARPVSGRGEVRHPSRTRAFSQNNQFHKRGRV